MHSGQKVKRILDSFTHKKPISFGGERCLVTAFERYNGDAYRIRVEYLDRLHRVTDRVWQKPDTQPVHVFLKYEPESGVINLTLANLSGVKILPSS